jgi:hypothetical protein
MTRHRTTGAWVIPKLRGKFFLYFYYVHFLKLKFLIVTNVVHVMQLGWFTNEAGDALSQPPNSATSHSTLRSFAEVSMVSISLLHPNISLNY